MNVIAVFDAGKTNKKIFLFDEQYKVVWEQAGVFEEITDEDGFPCEDLQQLTDWVRHSLVSLFALPDFRIRAINFSAYGASFVHLGEGGTPLAPLYNYLKPYPEELKQQFYDGNGGEAVFSLLTASPVLGNLNSGMQLYRMKEENPGIFACIHTSLHLPQYLSYLLTGRVCSDITSIGCHTHLWNFSEGAYHEWVYREGIIDKLAPILPSTSVFPLRVGGSEAGAVEREGRLPLVGIGLHDSSAAIIPYLASFKDPFVLISTGTWCISMNPFNDTPLTAEELQKDCLCYLSYQGRPVKASRLFAGYEHEQQVLQLAARFLVDPALTLTMSADREIFRLLREGKERGEALVLENFEQAYHQLMMDIMDRQVASTRLIIGRETKRIYVDGGFGKNRLFMHLLAEACGELEVYSATIPQATAMGAALAIHPHWNNKAIPDTIINLNRII